MRQQGRRFPMPPEAKPVHKRLEEVDLTDLTDRKRLNKEKGELIIAAWLRGDLVLREEIENGS